MPRVHDKRIDGVTLVVHPRTNTVVVDAGECFDAGRSPACSLCVKELWINTVCGEIRGQSVCGLKPEAAAAKVDVGCFPCFGCGGDLLSKKHLDLIISVVFVDTITSAGSKGVRGGTKRSNTVMTITAVVRIQCTHYVEHSTSNSIAAYKPAQTETFVARNYGRIRSTARPFSRAAAAAAAAGGALVPAASSAMKKAHSKEKAVDKKSASTVRRLPSFTGLLLLHTVLRERLDGWIMSNTRKTKHTTCLSKRDGVYTCLRIKRKAELDVR